MGDETLFRPGERIAEKYIVERELGRGGMAVVVAARHAELGHEVAIKALHPAALREATSVERLMREARAAAGLQSEHATRVFDIGRLPSGAPFLVLERLRGMDLHELLEKRGRLSPGEAARVVFEACDAIAEAHEGGIVHRDLKPSNLFLAQRRDGSAIVKVLDFGIAKASEGPEETALTTTSSSLGTPLYMAPEQILDAKRVTAAVDVWALGVTLYELVSDQIPWEVQNVHALLAKIITEPPVPLRKRRPDVPPAFEAIVDRCLARAPADRFPSASELARALAPLALGPLPTLPDLELAPPTEVDGAAALQVADTDLVLRAPDVRDTTTNPIRKKNAELKMARPNAAAPAEGAQSAATPARTAFEWNAGSTSGSAPRGTQRWVLVMAAGLVAAASVTVWLAFGVGRDGPPVSPTSLAPAATSMSVVPVEPAPSATNPVVLATAVPSPSDGPTAAIVTAAPGPASAPPPGATRAPPSGPATEARSPAPPAPPRPPPSQGPGPAASANTWGPMK